MGAAFIGSEAGAAGALAPYELRTRFSWLRLILLRAGFPAPRTQIPVYDEYGQLVAVLDMGWEHIKWQSSTTATTTGPTVDNSRRTSGGPKP